jgi:alanine racemase
MSLRDKAVRSDTQHASKRPAKVGEAGAADTMDELEEGSRPNHKPTTLGGSYLTAEVSASAVRANFAALRTHISPGTAICAVVKANCYGHGTVTLLGLMEELADCLGVATPEEALYLRRLGYERQIIMFLPSCAWASGQELHEALDYLIAEGVTLTVVAPSEVTAIAEATQRVGAKADVHVKIDTGMGRGGCPAAKAPELIRQVRECEALNLTGLYTHFAVADEADKSFTREQLACFLDTVGRSGGRDGLTLHAANSAATIDLADSHLDMVRPGIALYGYQPSDDMRTALPLRPAMRLAAQLMQIKTLPAGSRCSYGLTYQFKHDTPVGLVPVGYADGYVRSLSNRSTMRIRSQDVPIRGRVSMDQTIIDLTDVPDARVGDEVEIISADPLNPHSLENLARLAGTIPYELSCRLGRRVRRMLVD